MTALDFIIFAFAAYRIGSLLSWEIGPYGILDKLRRFVGVRYDSGSKPFGQNELAKMILCVYCNTVWIAIISIVLYYIFGNVIVGLATPFAVSGAAILINNLSEHK